MQKLGIYSLLACMLVGQAQAVEFGPLRALQIGPAGDSPQFADLEDYQAEAGLVVGRHYGKIDINDDSTLKAEGTSFATQLVAGASMSPTRQFSLTANLNLTIASDTDEEQRRTEQKSHLDTGLYQHELGFMAVYRGNPLVVGGGIGVKIIGAETRDFSFGDSRWSSEVSSATMPILRLFGGFDTKTLAATAGVRFFSKGDNDVKAKDSSSNQYEYDLVRRHPGEVHADGKWRINREAELAASIAYVLTGQASEDVDEFSMQYSSIGSRQIRRLAGQTRNKNHLRLGLGGKFQPNKMLGLLAGLSYTAASYRSEEYASLEHANLGGLRLDFGTDVVVEQIRGFFHVGYQVDSTAKFAVTTDERDPTQLNRTQRLPLSNGDEVKVKQGRWELLAGGGIQL